LLNSAPYQCRAIHEARFSRESSMLGAISLASVLLGAATAYVADRFPARVEVLETAAGVLLIGGLALFGSALPTV
jgi:hypothetical protein